MTVEPQNKIRLRFRSSVLMVPYCLDQCPHFLLIEYQTAHLYICVFCTPEAHML